MGLAILSKTPIEKNKVISDIVISAINARLNINIEENAVSKTGRIEMQVSKDFESHEYLVLDIISIEEQKSMVSKGLLNYTFMEEKYFMIASTSDGDCEHIIFDFLLEYLSINPSHIGCINELAYVSKEKLIDLNENMGFQKGWMSGFVL